MRKCLLVLLPYAPFSISRCDPFSYLKALETDIAQTNLTHTYSYVTEDINWSDFKLTLKIFFLYATVLCVYMPK